MSHLSPPWKVLSPLKNETDPHKQRKYHVYQTALSGHTEGIADTASYEWTFTPEQHAANARLIAAAPELLDALVDLINQLDLIGIPDWHGAEGLSLKHAHAAITKATKEQP